MNWYKKSQFILDFENIYDGSHNMQSDFTLVIRDKTSGDFLGYVEYSIFEEEIYINFIEVKPEFRRKGLGSRLINKMKELNPGLDIHWGLMTTEGDKLKQKMETNSSFFRKNLISLVI